MIQQTNHLNFGQEIGLNLIGSCIKFKTSMIKSNLWDYNDAYIHVKGTMEVPNTGTTVAPNNRHKK